jgi:hypothetical protein
VIWILIALIVVGTIWLQAAYGRAELNAWVDRNFNGDHVAAREWYLKNREIRKRRGQ